MSTIEAVIFDLDGTLTEPILDFNVIRQEIGIEKGPVWETIIAMAPADRRAAEEVLLRHELQAAGTCTLQPSTLPLLGELARRRVPAAVLTRNCRAAWDIVRDRFNLQVGQVYAREDGPMKPDPAPVMHLARRMAVDPARTLVVGDYLFDIQSGKSAGTRTALLINHGPVPDYAAIADHVIRDLLELVPILNQWDDLALVS